MAASPPVHSLTERIPAGALPRAVAAVGIAEQHRSRSRASRNQGPVLKVRPRSVSFISAALDEPHCGKRLLARSTLQRRLGIVIERGAKPKRARTPGEKSAHAGVPAGCTLLQ